MDRNSLTPYLFLLPTLFILGTLQYFAWGWNIDILLHKVTLYNYLGKWPWAGLQNFVTVFSDEATIASIKNTIIFSSSCIVIQMSVGLIIAYLLFRTTQSRERIVRPLVILPWLCSVVIAAFGWQLMLSKDVGLVNWVIAKLGINPINFLGTPSNAMISIIVANVWWGLPFTILFMGSGLASISPRMIEAAKIDGASEWTIFRNIALPLLKPFLVMNLILISVWTINMFGLILILTEGGPLNATRVFPLHGYLAAFEQGRFSFGAVITFVSVVVNLALVYLYIRVADVELF